MLTKTTVSLMSVAWLGATHLCFAGNDVTVEIPTAANEQAATVQVDSPLTKQKNVTVAGVSALEKNVVEQEKERCWNWAVDLGYTSEYNFRGTDLMPGSDGGGFFNAEVSKWNLPSAFTASTKSVGREPTASRWAKVAGVAHRRVD